MNNRHSGRVFRRYGLAIVSVGVAAALTRILREQIDFGLTPLLFAAVLLSAWYGGLGPGLVATALASAATALLLLKGQSPSFFAIRDHILRLLGFSLVSVLAASLHGALRQAAEASQAAREAAEAASKAKSQFLAMVSHELRTPLSPVLMIAEMLEHDADLPSRIRDDIRCIRRNVDLELRLIEDLVDLSRIASGKMALREETFDLANAIRAAVDVCRQGILDKQIDLSLILESGPLPIVGDPVRLQQVFWNLLRNAVKFTPDSGRISITVQNVGASQFNIAIGDSGIGIDPRRLSAIFKAFEQGEPDIHVRFGGLGLGLAICQALVEAHHGTLTAASEGKGRGATFTVTLPIAPVAGNAIACNDCVLATS